jgi:hypothetical protein
MKPLLSVARLPLSRRAFGLLLGSACAATVYDRRASAQHTPADLPFPKMSRGISLHHLLNWPDTKPGDGKTEYVWPPFETANYKISDGELARLKAMGFDFLRLTADPSIFLAVDKTRLEYLTKLVRQTVSRLLHAGFKVIFDLHPVAVNPDYEPLKLVERLDSPALRAYGRLVEHMARFLHDLPHDQFAFELMNEPWLDSEAEIARWQPMMELLHTRARAGSATLPLVITGAQWSSPKALMQLDLRPFRGSNVLYTIHYYDPHTFTHQGVAGDEGAYLSGLQWPANHDNIVQVQAAALARIEATKKPPAVIHQLKEVTRKLLADYELTAHNPERLHADFAAVAKWATSENIPAQRLFLGEFGCVASAHQIPLGEDRIRWLRAIRDAAQEFGFPWALWAYKGSGMALFDDQGSIDKPTAQALGLPL